MGLELTKKHEAHYRGTVENVFEDLQREFEGSRLKGEVTLVIGPYLEVDLEYAQFLKGSSFDKEKDAV